MSKKAIFVASTGQHVGKTTTCLGLFSGLQKRFSNVGYMKPIGQKHVRIEGGVDVDKDVVLFKNLFKLKNSAKAMSPVLFPQGFTRDYLDGKINEQDLKNKITNSYNSLLKKNDCLVIEGTGHVGVGSIVNINNAEVASLLKTKVIIVASGGLGSSFDAMTLNKNTCDQLSVPVAGVILNRVFPEKREMILHYMSKALSRWNIPLLGCIPFDPFLSNPCMKDFEQLFQTTLLAGKEHRFRHFQEQRLVATSVERYRELIQPSQLIITPAIRDDIVLAHLSKYWDMKIQDPNQDLEGGIILTGSPPPKEDIVKEIVRANIPTLYTPVNSYKAMEMITSFTAKLREEDTKKVSEARELVERHIDFDLLVEKLFT